VNEIRSRDIQIVGVSKDTVAEQKIFSDRYGAYYPLLADTDGRVVRAFGVGENRKGWPDRQTFVLRNGRVIWHDEHSSTKRLAKEIIEAVDGWPPPPPD